MKPHDVLTQASNLIGERGQDYGGIENNFSNIASIFTTMTGKAFDAYDVALVMVAVKIARIRQSPYKDDNYLDAINYLAIAHELRPSNPSQVPPAPYVEPVETPVDELRRLARAGRV